MKLVAFVGFGTSISITCFRWKQSVEIILALKQFRPQCNLQFHFARYNFTGIMSADILLHFPIKNNKEIYKSSASLKYIFLPQTNVSILLKKGMNFQGN